MRPNENQLNFLQDLIQQLGKEDDYDFMEISETWSKEEVSELIDYFLNLRATRATRVHR